MHHSVIPQIHERKPSKARKPRKADCWTKLEMTAAPIFKLLSAVRIGFGFNAVLCGKGTGIDSIMVTT